MTYDRYPDLLRGPMSRGQANTLRSLSIEAYQPKQFAEDLTAEEAAKRIDALRRETNWPILSEQAAAEGPASELIDGSELGRIARAMRCVGCPKPRLESAALIEAMHARVRPAALKQDVVAIHLPRFGQGGTDHRTAVPSPHIIGMRHDVLENPVQTPAPQQVGNGDEHAGRDDPGICIRHQDHQPFAREGL